MATHWPALRPIKKDRSPSRSSGRRSVRTRRRHVALEVLEVRSLLSTTVGGSSVISPADNATAGAGSIVQYGDDSLPGFSTSGGQWVASAGGGYLGNQTISDPANGAGVATWTFNVTPGTYTVAATWPAAGDQATNATYFAFDGSTELSKVTVDQQISIADFADTSTGNARWESLGGPVAIAGTQLIVQLSNNGANGPVVADGVRIQQVSSLVFRPQGPTSVAQYTPIGSTVTNPGLPYVGAVQAVVPNPANVNQMWIATVNGGIWRTDDATDVNPNWVPETDQAGSLSMADLELDPTDPTNQTLVAAVGRVSNFAGEGDALTGLLRTTDGGTTWLPMGQAAGGAGTVSLQGLTIRSVMARGNLIMAAAVSTNVLPYGDQAGGLFRSVDTGKTFQPVAGLGGVTDAYTVTGVPGALATGDPNARRLFVSTNLGVFMSEDDGQDWSPINGTGSQQLVLPAEGVDMIKLAVSTPAAGQTPVLYAAVAVESTVTALYRSDDLGKTWVPLNLPPSTTFGQASTNLALLVAPQDPNLIYMSFAEVNVFRGGYSAPGANAVQWTKIGASGSATGGPNDDSRNLALDANGNLIEVDDGGIYEMTNPTGAGTWSSLLGNLQDSELHDVAYDPATQTILDGSQDNGDPGSTASSNQTWADQNIVSADGGQVQVAPDGMRYTSSQEFQNFATRLLGGAAKQPGLHLLLPDGQKAGTNLYAFVEKHEGELPFVTPFRLDSAAPRQLIIGGKYLYESRDQGKTVRLLSRRSFGETTTLAYGGSAMDPRHPGRVENDPGVLYVGTNDRRSYLVLKTRSNAPLRIVRTYPGASPRQIILDPNNWRIAFIVDDANRVWRTTNAGATAAGWTELTGNLTDPNLRTLTVVPRPGNPAQYALLAGGQGGVYRMLSTQPGTWGQLGGGLPNALVYDMQYTNVNNSDILVVGTLGRGNFTIKGLAANPATFAPPPTVSPIPAQGVVTGTSSGSIAFAVGGGSVSAADLVVTATSSNPNLVPNAGITLGGAGADRTLQFTPAAQASGSGTITVMASDGTSSSFQTFNVVVGTVAPALSFFPVNGQTVLENTSTRAIPFVVANAQDLNDVTYTAESSNTTLIPKKSIIINRLARTVTITPAANKAGTATITLTAAEGGATTKTELVVTVVPVAASPPVIAPIRNQVRDLGVSPIKVALSVTVPPGNTGLGYIPDEPDSTLQVPFSDVILAVQSSNPDVIPLRDAGGDNQVTIDQSGAKPSSFTLEAIPADGKVGTSQITISAYNGEFSLNRSFRIRIKQGDVAAVRQVATRIGSA